eukprot:scaffold268127_cov21-Tisochrysis_lutea.AAC.1
MYEPLDQLCFDEHALRTYAVTPPKNIIHLLVRLLQPHLAHCIAPVQPTCHTLRTLLRLHSPLATPCALYYAFTAHLPHLAHLLTPSHPTCHTLRTLLRHRSPLATPCALYHAFTPHLPLLAHFVIPLQPLLRTHFITLSQPCSTKGPKAAMPMQQHNEHVHVFNANRPVDAMRVHDSPPCPCSPATPRKPPPAWHCWPEWLDARGPNPAPPASPESCTLAGRQS